MNLLEKIGNLGNSIQTTEEDVKRNRIINYISLLAITVLITHSALNLINATYKVALINFVTALVFILILFFNSKEKYLLARILLFYIFPLFLILLNFYLGELGSEYFFFSMIILAFYIFENPFHKYFISTLYFFIFIAIKLMLKYHITLELYHEVKNVAFWFNILNSFVALFLISSIYTKENKNHLLRLNKQNNELNEQNNFINKLLKELNHRVKNNLQIVFGLFNLQRYNTKNEELINALSDAGNRIITIALLHKTLYQENIASTNVSIREYILDLCNYLLQASGIDEETELDLQIENLKVSIEESVHIGLLINELITNSIKYGIKNIEKKKLSIEFKKENEFAKFRISDNGGGFAENFFPNTKKQFGLFLIKTIVENKDGEILFYNKNGAVVEIKIKLATFDN